jgi:translation initiation factor 2B subunit (eIF-2B alpha/beta/delta family)
MPEMMINYPEFEAMLLEQEAGASTVLFKYINILNRYFSENTGLSKTKQKEALEYIYTEVRKAHPLMAIFPNLHNFILEHIKKGKRSIPEILTIFAEKTNENIDKTIGACVGKLIKDGSHIFTFSHSSVVRKAIMEAAEQGRRFEVVLTEARPVGEGLGLAKYLGRAGIPVSLYTDAAMELAVSRCDMVLVGTDWYWHRGFINKIGTHAALRVAEEREKSFYILTDSSKHMPTPPSDWSRDKHPESQILMESIENVTVFNPYFESIWYRGVDGIVIDGEIKTLDNNNEIIM